MNPVEQTIKNLDNQMGGYGYDGGNFGMTDLPGARLPQLGRPGVGGPTNYSVNQQIAQKTAGTSTFQVNITCTKTGTGSGNTYNPVFLFGGDAFTSASKGYTAVRANSPVQATSSAYTNNKNVINFRYSADGSNYSDYSVTLGTEGEYPFLLNALTGPTKMTVVGMQMSISDASQTSQLGLSLQTFFLNEFGKSTENDLTTPKDLYQQATDGIFIPHEFPISGRQGLILNVLEVNAFTVSLYFYVRK